MVLGRGLVELILLLGLMGDFGCLVGGMVRTTLMILGVLILVRFFPPSLPSQPTNLHPVTQTWSKPLIHGTPPSRRRAHTTIHYHNLLLIFGGGNGSHALNDLHALDLSDLSHLVWRELETKGEKPIARGYHSMTRVGDKAVVFGGSDGTECFSDLFLLDLGLSFSPFPSLSLRLSLSHLFLPGL